MHREQRHVPYPAALMYRVVADVEQYPQFLPWVLGLRVKSRDPRQITAEMLVGYKGFREHYTSRITLDPDTHRIDVEQAEGPFRMLDTHWQFTPDEGGDEEGCLVDFSIAFAFKNRVLDAVAGASFKRALLRMTEAFEAQAKKIMQEESVKQAR
jgi:coenzyme Q-binding protein COQ10